jgi:cytochrome P450
MRRKLSPVFTSGKIKTMFETAINCGDNLVRLVDGEPSKEFMLKELMSVFTSDIIASCVFGIDLSELIPLDFDVSFR